MNDNITIESLLKEIKNNLNKYENLIKLNESNISQKSIQNLEKSKKNLENNIKLLKNIIKSEEDIFVLGSYEELKEELNKRYLQIKKREKQKIEKEKFDNLFNNKNDLNNLTNLQILGDENASLKNTLSLSSEITNNMDATNIELEDQRKRLDKTTDTVVKILQRVPIIEQMFGKIKFHKIKEKIIIGCVLGFCFVLGIYLTFYR